MAKGFTLLETVIFIVLAAIVIPIFYLSTQPVLKDMMSPAVYVRARFAAERKMEELMAYRFTDTTMNVGSVGPSAVTTDTNFPAGEYAAYQWQWAINYLDCNTGGSGCASYTGASLTTVAYTTNYKQIDLTVTGPAGTTYRITSAVTSRY